MSVVYFRTCPQFFYSRARCCLRCGMSTGEKLASARRFDQVVVATSGEMALMRIVHPIDFARIKLAPSQQAGRDANKRGKDALQASVVNTLVENYLN